VTIGLPRIRGALVENPATADAFPGWEEMVKTRLLAVRGCQSMSWVLSGELTTVGALFDIAVGLLSLQQDCPLSCPAG
jgi:hypothetical protein